LAILVTGVDPNKFLAAAKLIDGSGEEQANAVLKHLDAGNKYSERVVGMCFDTTRTNTGAQKGACARIERALGRDLFHFACRHHVFELILKAVLVAMLNLDEKSPEVQIFKDFKETTWCRMNKQNYKSCLEDSEVPKK